MVNELKFYNFRQNNSGGVFTGDLRYVVVEAASASDANRLAEDFGLYFDGVENDMDCECCGDRWYRAWEDHGDSQPSSYYGHPLTLTDEKTEESDIVVLFADGTKKFSTFSF